MALLLNALPNGDFESTAINVLPSGWSATGNINFSGVESGGGFNWTGSKYLQTWWAGGLFNDNGSVSFPTLTPTPGAGFASIVYANTLNAINTGGLTLSSSVGSLTGATTNYGYMAAVSGANAALSGALTQNFFWSLFIQHQVRSDYYIDDAWVVFHGATVTAAQLNALIAPVNLAYDPSFTYDTLAGSPASFWTAVNGASLSIVSDPILGNSCQVSVTAANTNPVGIQCTAMPFGVNPVSVSCAANVTTLPDSSVALFVNGVNVASVSATGRVGYGGTLTALNKSVSANGTVQLLIPTPVTGHTYTFTFTRMMISPTATLPAYVDGDLGGYYWANTRGNSATLLAQVTPDIYSVSDPVLGRVPGIH